MSKERIVGNVRSRNRKKKVAKKKVVRKKTTRAAAPQDFAVTAPSANYGGLPTPEPKAAKVEEIDPSQLTQVEAQRRCGDIYKLERALEKAQGAHAKSMKRAKETREALSAAERTLGKEIHEQRVGPGPLFNPTGGKK